MNTKMVFYPLILCLLILVGCKASFDDITKWRAQGNVTKLIKALESQDLGIPEAAINALGDIRSQTAVEPLTALLDSTNPKVVTATVEALIKIGGNAAISALETAVYHEGRNISVRATEGLGELKATQSLDVLHDVLGSNDQLLAVTAAKSIGQIANEKSIDPLVVKLTDRTSSLRKEALKSLILIGGPRTRDGIAISLNDINTDIREMATSAMIAQGPSSASYGIANLQSSQMLVAKSAIEILQGIDAVPTQGSDLVRYKFAELFTESAEYTDEQLITSFQRMGDHAVQALLEALAHENPRIRSIAKRAIGEGSQSTAVRAVLAVEQLASDEGREWYQGRANWVGYPNWKLDLWAAPIALDPNFKLDGFKYRTLEAKGTGAERLLSAPDFRAPDTFIPLLISQLDARNKIVTEEEKQNKEITESPYLRMVIKRLAQVGDIAETPLVAALAAREENVVYFAAKTLTRIGTPEAVQAVLDLITKKIEDGENIIESPLYPLLMTIEVTPEIEKVLLKIRPNTDRCKFVVQQKYPDIRILGMKTFNEDAGDDKPIGFAVNYSLNRKKGVIQVIFKKSALDEWHPDPALPDELDN